MKSLVRIFGGLALTLACTTSALADDVSVIINGRTYQCSEGGGGGSYLVDYACETSGFHAAVTDQTGFRKDFYYSLTSMGSGLAEDACNRSRASLERTRSRFTGSTFVGVCSFDTQFILTKLALTKNGLTQASRQYVGSMEDCVAGAEAINR